MNVVFIGEIISSVTIVCAFLFSVHKIHSYYVDTKNVITEIIKSQIIKISEKSKIDYEDLDYAESLYKIYESMGKNGLGKKAINVIRDKYYGGESDERSS